MPADAAPAAESTRKTWNHTTGFKPYMRRESHESVEPVCGCTSSYAWKLDIHVLSLPVNIPKDTMMDYRRTLLLSFIAVYFG
jgi:hypothetical protein